jgi:hypothetical protein
MSQSSSNITLINFPAVSDHFPKFSPRPDERPTTRMLSPAARATQKREEELLYAAQMKF